MPCSCFSVVDGVNPNFKKAKLPVQPKIKLPVNSHLESMVQKFFKMNLVKTAKQFFKLFQFNVIKQY